MNSRSRLTPAALKTFSKKFFLGCLVFLGFATLRYIATEHDKVYRRQIGANPDSTFFDVFDQCITDFLTVKVFALLVPIGKVKPA